QEERPREARTVAPLVPPPGSCGGQDHEDGAQGIDALDVRLAPEARAESEEERCQQGGNGAEANRATKPVEEPARGGRAERAEETHAPGDRAGGQQERPELAEEHV